MTTIQIKDLRPASSKSFCQELSTEDINEILGGWYVSLFWGALEFGSGNK